MKQASIARPQKHLDRIFNRIFYCPSCTTWRLSQSQRPSLRIHQRRPYSTQSLTAVNATKQIPSRYKSLYEALLEVKKDAAAHVNLSRLQLALQSLETARPVIRVGFLGFNIQDTARRLVRLLLADALENEPGWEDQILQAEGAQGFLIRYGESVNSSLPRRTSVPVLQIPAPSLERLNVEILVSSINGPGNNGYSTPVDTFLSPAIGTPTDAGGRQVTIRQPVHRSLVVANGLDELVAAVELFARTKFESRQDRNAVGLAVNLQDSGITASHDALVIDVGKAEKGLQAIRESLKQATVYEHSWLQAGIPAVSDWIVLASDGTESANLKTLPPVIGDLIAAILISADSSVDVANVSFAVTNASRGLNALSKTSLEAAIDEFSRSAHQELQSGLASAWSSRNWRKLAWFKLFWRVDDVDLIVTDLVTSAWLPKTERAVYELSGRLSQVGINPVMQETWRNSPQESTALESITAPVLESSAILASSSSESIPTQTVIRNEEGTPTVKIEPIPRPVPIASTISDARKGYIYASTTSLTSTAQQLVLRTLSISGLSAGLSGLAYLSSLSAGMYEAGTIFAVGTVFALWRMQGGWQTATRSLEIGLFEEGRTVISSIVGRMRSLVELKATAPIDPIEKAAIDNAHTAVQKASSELEKLQPTTTSTTVAEVSEQV